jgi:hypothetical protein
MNFTRVICDRRAAQTVMHNRALSLQTGNEILRARFGRARRRAKLHRLKFTSSGFRSDARLDNVGIEGMAASLSPAATIDIRADPSLAPRREVASADRSSTSVETAPQVSEQRFGRTESPDLGSAVEQGAQRADISHLKNGSARCPICCTWRSWPLTKNDLLFTFKFICKLRMRDETNHVVGFRPEQAKQRQSFP